MKSQPDDEQRADWFASMVDKLRLGQFERLPDYPLRIRDLGALVVLRQDLEAVLAEATEGPVVTGASLGPPPNIWASAITAEGEALVVEIAPKLS